jgi:hypothetical protein
MTTLSMIKSVEKFKLKVMTFPSLVIEINWKKY